MAESDISGWIEFGEVLADVQDEIPSARHDMLTQLGEEIVDDIRGNLLAGDHIWTSTYFDSLNSLIDGEGKLHIGLMPIGSQAERLPVYWKVMETGASPNLDMPSGPLIQWAGEKFGNPALGYMLARSNRAGRAGIRANPVLSDFFQFGEDFTPVAMTPRTEIRMSSAGERFFGRLETVFYSSGPRVVRRGSGGRFVPR